MDSPLLRLTPKPHICSKSGTVPSVARAARTSIIMDRPCARTANKAKKHGKKPLRDIAYIYLVSKKAYRMVYV